jgi:hypothetical protein
MYETIIAQRPRAPIPKLLHLRYLEGNFGSLSAFRPVARGQWGYGSVAFITFIAVTMI